MTACLSFSVIWTSIFLNSISDSSISRAIDFCSADSRFISLLLIVTSVSMSMSANESSWRVSLVSSYFSSTFLSFSYFSFIEWNFSFSNVSSFFASS